MENRAHALAAGIFVLFMGLVTALAVWWFRQDHQARAYYVLETRKNVGGLNKQAVVRYRGIRAGKVDQIKIDPNDPRIILVRINLDQDFVLTKGTTANLASQGITGLTYVALEDDGSDMTPLAPGPDGSLPRITLRPTFMDNIYQNATNIMNQLSSVTARLERVLSDKNADNLERGIDNIARASDGLRELPQVMAALRTALSPE